MNILIRSITQSTSKAFTKGKDRARADKGKRPAADDNGNSSVLKRSRDEAGPSGSPRSSCQPALKEIYPCICTASHSTILAFSVLSCMANTPSHAGRDHFPALILRQRLAILHVQDALALDAPGHAVSLED